MAVLESKLIIGADDQTGAAFASVMARIKEMQTQLASVNGALGGAMPRGAAIPGSLPSRVASIPSVAPLRASPSASGFWDTIGSAALAITGVSALRSGFQEAMAQQHERMRQTLADMSAEEVSKAERLSADLAAKYPAVPQSEILHSIRTARTGTGTVEEAMDMAEPLAKLRVVAQAANPKASVEEMREEFDKLIKALEIAGVATDPKRLRSYTNDIAKSLNAFGDQLKPMDYFEILKMAKQAAPGLSERFLMTTLSTFGTEIGGASAGVAASSFNKTLISGNPRYFTHTGAMTLHDLGLIGEDDLTRTKTGEIMGIKPFHHVKDWRLARSDPDLWITQDLLPAIKKKFGDDPDATAAVMGQIFNNSNANNLALQIASQQGKFGKNAALWGRAMGLGGAELLGSSDASTTLTGAGNAITRLIAQQFNTDLLGQLGYGISKGLGWITPNPLPHTDIVKDLADDVKGWKDLFRSIHIGGPETSGQWHDEMRATSSLWNNGYRPGDIENEGAREHSRAASSSPSSVSVSGSAQVDHVVHVEVTLDPALRAKIDQLMNSQTFTVPLIGEGSGRMDSDAGPHRAGGIGSM